MRPITIKICSTNLISILGVTRFCNRQFIHQQHTTINPSRGYKFSVGKNVPVYEHNQSLNLMLKQLQIVQKLTSNQLTTQQKIKQTGLKIRVLIQQQIEFINSNQIQIAKSLQKLKFPLQSLKDQLTIVIQLIQDIISHIETIDVYSLNSKYKIVQYIHSYLLCKPKKSNLIARLVQIIQSEIKIRQALSFYKSFSCSANIINTHPSQLSQPWKKIYLLSYISKQQMNKGYNLLSDAYGLIAGAIMMKKFLKGFQFYYYYLQKNWRSLYSILIFKNMRVENAKKLLNVLEENPYKKILELAYDAIVTNKIIYVPAEGDFQQTINIFEQTKNSIPVRVLYYKQLPIIEDKRQSLNQNDCIQNILIHTHGGGFVALSSHSTQNYTRKWANHTKIPVFSIDYRMAPDYAFPQAHNDCFQVYRFLTTQIHKYMRIKPVNIIIGGDSAGANLSCAITTFALKNQLIIPKALYLAYPLLNAESRYYPSRKYVLNDPLMHPALIKTFINSYFPNQADYTNPIASPLLLTEQFVGGRTGDSRFPLRWPKTVIAVGTKDPLRDQSLLLMERMTDSNIDCKCFLYENMSHAFLSLDKLIKNTSKTIEHSIQILKQMIDAQKDNSK